MKRGENERETEVKIDREIEREKIRKRERKRERERERERQRENASARDQSIQARGALAEFSAKFFSQYPLFPNPVTLENRTHCFRNRPLTILF